MTKLFSTLKVATIACLLLIAQAVSSQQLPKLSADKAGTIEQPSGQLAFARDGSIWVMNVTGSNPPLKISEATNANGRISWAPDGRRVVYTRSGMVDMKGPDLLGGQHRIYDMFIASLDSLEKGAAMNWVRISEDLGSRDPEWGPDNRIIYWKDMNANQVNSVFPNYQLCMIDPDGSGFEVLRKDWQSMEEGQEYQIAPTRSKDGKVAFVHFFQMKPQGIVVLPLAKIGTSTEEFKSQAMSNKDLVSPSFSPDGKWIAHISNDMNDAGLYIANADFSERYLVFVPPVSTYIRTDVPSWSPDSKWITFATTDGSIWIVDLTGTGARRLTPPGLDSYPAWSK